MIYSKQLITELFTHPSKSHASSCVNTILESFVETFLTMILANRVYIFSLVQSCWFLIDSWAVLHFYFPQQRERSETVRSEAESPSSDPRAHDHDWKVHFTLNHTPTQPANIPTLDKLMTLLLTLISTIISFSPNLCSITHSFLPWPVYN